MNPWNIAAKALPSEHEEDNYAPDKQHKWLKYLLKHFASTMSQWHLCLGDQQIHHMVRDELMSWNKISALREVKR